METMDKIKRMLTVHIPVKACNFRCDYCYITLQHHWNSDVPAFRHTPAEIRKAFSKERMGGACFINLCGSGETLISPEIIPAIRALLEEGHYVEVVTNGSLTKRFDELCKFPRDLLRRLTFKFSFHYLELKRLSLFETYFNNIKKMQRAGCSFTVEMTPTDNLEPYKQEIRELCIAQLGAPCHCTIARNDTVKGIPVLSSHTLEEYSKTWSAFDSEMLQFKTSVFGRPRREFCYAGDWSMYINLLTGDMNKCYGSPIIGNIYEEISRPIPFEAIGKCSVAHCYNGYAHLTFGIIPELKTPVYANIRNRICADSTEWLTPQMKAFMSGKLVESNQEYNSLKKACVILKGGLLNTRNSAMRKLRGALPDRQAAFLKKRLHK